MRVIELNDAGIAVHSEEATLVESPGYAIAGDDALVLGEPARGRARVQPLQAHDRFWDELSLEPLPRPAGRMHSVADLAYAHLDQVWRDAGGRNEPALVVVPGTFSRQQLGLVLGIARECGIEVVGFVDAAVAACAEPRPGRALLHLDATLHRAVLTRLTQGARLSRASVEASERAGCAGLETAWARAISAVFVRDTRFDALHHGETEQALYDNLPRWVAAADAAGSTSVELRFGGKEYAVVLKREHLLDAAQSTHAALRELVAASTRPGEPLCLAVTSRIAAWPGAVAALAELPSCEVVTLDVRAAAQGAFALAGHVAAPDGGETLSFVTHVPWRVPTVVAAAQAGAAGGLLPTHVLYQARAHVIAGEPLVVGADIPAGARGFNLAGALQGVSRRHCSFFGNGSAVLLEDHSTYGTFVNGARIEGRVAVAAGDRVRIGTPGEELQLIAVE
jgi:hypothetical protein